MKKTIPQLEKEFAQKVEHFAGEGSRIMHIGCAEQGSKILYGHSTIVYVPEAFRLSDWTMDKLQWIITRYYAPVVRRIRERVTVRFGGSGPVFTKLVFVHQTTGQYRAAQKKAA